MDDDLDLRDFSNVRRLFPLPGVVLFPHAVLPLHIFEPRYRQMTEDALAGDRLVTIVQLRPAGRVDVAGRRRRSRRSAASGRILQHERLPDGRFNFLLLGRKRVRLIREVPSGKLYRMAEVRDPRRRPGRRARRAAPGRADRACSASVSSAAGARPRPRRHPRDATCRSAS